MSDPLYDHDERELTILYATEQGNAKEYAERTARQCRRLHIAVRVYDIDEYQLVRAYWHLNLSRTTDNISRMIYFRQTS